MFLLADFTSVCYTLIDKSGFVEVLSPLEDTEMKISRNASCGNWVSAVMKRLLIAFLALIISWVGSSNAIASEGSVETVPCVNDPVYHSNLISFIGEDIPYSKAIDALIIQPHAMYTEGNYSITIEEYIYDGCNVFVLYSIETQSNENVLFSSDYLHFSGINEWIDGEYSSSAGDGKLCTLNDQYGYKRTFFARMQLSPDLYGHDDLTLSFTGWFFHQDEEIELTEGGFSTQVYKEDSPATLPAIIESLGIGKQVAQVEIELPIKAQTQEIVFLPSVINASFSEYTLSIDCFTITPLSVHIEASLYADELTNVTHRRSYRFFDAEKNMLLENISWDSMEMEDEFGVSFIRYFGDYFGESDNLPATIYLVPYNTKEADSLLDENEDVNWVDAITQVSRWDEAVEVNLSKK